MDQPSKVALITGASGGIGLELALVFAKRGHDLVIVARSLEKLQELAQSLQQQYNIRVRVIAADLSEMSSVKNIYQTLKQENITVEYLINNAGFGDFGLFIESDWDKQEQMINLNITALTYLTRLYLPEMVNRKSGRIMNVASTASFQPGPLMSVYYASKAYVLHFSEAIADEVRNSGVTITALCPGATESGFQKAAANEESKLIKGKKLPSSKEVAEYGYSAMMKGKRVAVHGTLNYLMTLGPRFAPRRLVVWIARKIQESK
jgi:uncharacterized protein